MYVLRSILQSVYLWVIFRNHWSNRSFHAGWVNCNNSGDGQTSSGSYLTKIWILMQYIHKERGKGKKTPGKCSPVITSIRHWNKQQSQMKYIFEKFVMECFYWWTSTICFRPVEIFSYHIIMHVWETKFVKSSQDSVIY